MNRARVQCLVIRDNKILMVNHKHDGKDYFTLPGGGIEEGETPKQGAKRELFEECLVVGSKLKLISKVIHDNHYVYTFCADIGDQEPSLGEDPELRENPILMGVLWRTLDSLSERDRAYLWASGLFYYDKFANELSSWGNDISYPAKNNIT